MLYLLDDCCVVGILVCDFGDLGFVVYYVD